MIDLFAASADTSLLLLPLFLVIASGRLLAEFFPISEDTLSRVLSDFFMPLLVFVSLYESKISFQEMRDLSFSVLFMVIFMMSASFLWILFQRTSRQPCRAGSFMLPVIFMNSGFLGIPLMKLWGGFDAMNVMVLYDQIATIFLFTLGILISTGGITWNGVKGLLLSPILWALSLGFSANLLGVVLPSVLIETCTFAGNAAPPLAAFILGCSLKAGPIKINKNIAAGLFLRLAAGFLSGFLAVRLFGLEGTAAQVVMVTGALPAAVFSYVLPSRYGLPPSPAREIVIISSLAGIVTIPISFAIAGLL